MDFGTKYLETASEIREALDAKDFEQAHSLVHNLKGLAGNLEATEIQAAAVEMETLVKGQTAKTVSEEELNRKFSKLEEAVIQALKAVQTLGLPSEENNNLPPADWLAEIPEEQGGQDNDQENANRDGLLMVQTPNEMGQQADNSTDCREQRKAGKQYPSRHDGIRPACFHQPRHQALVGSLIASLSSRITYAVSSGSKGCWLLRWAFNTSTVASEGSLPSNPRAWIRCSSALSVATQ